jgi:hypothetical protein
VGRPGRSREYPHLAIGAFVHPTAGFVHEALSWELGVTNKEVVGSTVADWHVPYKPFPGSMKFPFSPAVVATSLSLCALAQADSAGKVYTDRTTFQSDHDAPLIEIQEKP